MEQTKKGIRFPKEYMVPFCSFFGFLLVFGIATSGKIFSVSNIGNIVVIAFPTMIAAIGAVFIYSHGGIDFSIGAVQGLSIMAMALVMDGNMDRIVLGVITCILTSLFSGFVLASLRVLLHIPALIASLCVQSVAKGVLQAVVTSKSVILPIGVVKLDVTWVKVLIMILLLVISVIIFERTAIGKGNKAMGGNIVAAKLMGVNTDAMIYFAHLLTNLAVGIAALFSAARISQVVATTGSGLEMDVLMAAVIGGMDINGGPKSKILNILVGAVIVAIMTNGFTLWGVNPTLIQGLKGGIFLVILFVTRPKDKNIIVQ